MNPKILILLIFTLFQVLGAEKLECEKTLGSNFGKLTDQVTISTIISLSRHDLPETPENLCIVDIGCRLISKSQKHRDLCSIYLDMKKRHQKITLDDLETQEIIAHLKRRHPDGLPNELKKIWGKTWHNIIFMVTMGIFIILTVGGAIFCIHRRNMTEVVIKLNDLKKAEEGEGLKVCKKCAEKN